jgi:hypothetical protein
LYAKPKRIYEIRYTMLLLDIVGTSRKVAGTRSRLAKVEHLAQKRFAVKYGYPPGQTYRQAQDIAEFFTRPEGEAVGLGAARRRRL